MRKAVYEFISKQTGDPIIEWRKCRWTGQDFPIFQGDIDMLEKLKITIGDKTYKPAINDLCPEARNQNKLMFKNERRLYKTKCALTGKSTISRVCPEMGLQVYTNEAWASDAWDYCSYGLEIDENKTVFEHIAKLVQTTPYQDLIGSFSNIKSNSVYTNYTSDIANCYYAFDCNTLENSCYVHRCTRSKQLFDCFWTYDSEICYDCIDCEKIHKCFFCNSSTSCHNAYYLYNCHGCYDCIGCVNLINKQYYVFNKQVSKSEYQTILSSLKNNYYNKDVINNFENLIKESPRQNLHIINSDGATGNYIVNSKNIFLSQFINDCEAMRYCDGMEQAQDCMDVCGYGHESFLMYNSTQVGRFSNHIYCCSTIGKGENLLYCIETKKSRNCFGCVNFKDKEYCIFNKQYAKAEYEQLVPKLIASMRGETSALGVQESRSSFLPSNFSPYPYNDTPANDHYPIQKIIINGEEKIINKDGHGTVTILQPEKFISDAILDLGGEEKIKIKRRTSESEVSTSLGENTIVCEVSGRPFRLVALEIEFYKKHNLPLPTKHPDIRHEERLAKRPGRKLSLRNCDKCGIEMLSVYSSESEFKVYCPGCYNKEIYG